MSKDDEEKRRAYALLFGISFQLNAGIMIMLRNIKEMTSIRLEGAKEDIELTLDGGKKICAQAKAVVRANSDFSNILSFFDDALESLSEAEGKYKEDVKELIYVTNSIKPIGSSDLFVQDETYNSFDDLTNVAKNKVSARIKKKKIAISTDKLRIYHLPFCGDDLNERYKYVRKAVETFLGTIRGGDGHGVPDKLLMAWQKDIFDSGTIQKSSVELSKADIIWPLVLIKIDASFDGDFYDQFDPIDLNELLNRYDELLSYKVEHWSTVTQILSDYQNYLPQKGVSGRGKMMNFIDEKWTNYIEEVQEVIEEESLQETFLKIMIFRILIWSNTIYNIKQSVNL